MFDSMQQGAANAARFDKYDEPGPQASPLGALTSTSPGAAGLYWLKAALAEIDYGVLLLDDEGCVVHANPVAHAEIHSDYPLQLAGNRLRTRDPRDASVLHAAIDGASRRGLRKLISLRIGAGELISLSVVPLSGIGEAGSDSGVAHHPRNAVLVMLGKRLIGGGLAIESFARMHGLSSGETRVLLALSAGLQPTELARRHGVAIATVRTQIGSIRAKTGASSIRSLLRQLTTLPPLQGVLHRGSAASTGSAHPGARVVQLQG